MFSYIFLGELEKTKLIPAMRKTVPLDLLVYGYKFHEDTYKKIMSPYLLSDIANSKYLTWKTHFAPLILLDHISDHNVNQKKFITKKT